MLNRLPLAAGVLTLAVTALTLGARAQQRSPQFFVEPLSDAKGQMGLGLALRRLTTVGTFMHTTAHPDDGSWRSTRAGMACGSRC